MASNTVRNSDWDSIEIDRPRGKQGRRHLHIGAWFPQGNLTQTAAMSGTEPQETWADEPSRTAMQSRYLSYANGLGRTRYGRVHLEWIARALELGPNQYDVDHLAEVVAATNQELREGRYQSLGHAIAGLPFGSISPHVISAVLRVMSPAKNLMPNWHVIIDDATASLSSRGLDARRLLRGLT